MKGVMFNAPLKENLRSATGADSTISARAARSSNSAATESSNAPDRPRKAPSS